MGDSTLCSSPSQLGTRNPVLHPSFPSLCIFERFKWDTKSFEPDFSISPVEGYISPGMDVPLEVTFHPCELSQEIYYDNLQCYIQGSKALKLSLSGCCVNIPMTKEVRRAGYRDSMGPFQTPGSAPLPAMKPCIHTQNVTSAAKWEWQ